MPSEPLCHKCRFNGKPRVPSEGPEAARLVIVGEAPAATEVAQGRPFAGKSGQILDRVLGEAGIDREACYVTNACLCYDREKPTPAAKEIAACRPRLLEEVKDRKPEVVLALGNAALRAFFGSGNITSERGAPRWSDEAGAWVLPTYHPAALLRRPGYYIDLSKDVARAADILAGRATALPATAEIQHVVLTDRQDVDALVERMRTVPELALDTETASDGRMLSLAMSWRRGTAVVLTERLLADPYTTIALNRALAGKCIIGHNLKYDLKVLWRHGISCPRTGFDTMLASYVLDERPGVHGLGKLARELLRVPEYKDAMARYSGHFEDCPPAELYLYNARDAAYTYALAEVLRGLLDASGKRVLEEILHPASDVLARMELTGVAIDQPSLSALDGELCREIAALEARLYKLAEGNFNPNSWPQVHKLLFDKLELPVPGRLSADEDALEILKEYHPLPGVLLEYRRKKKLHSTYVEGLKERLRPDGRVSTDFHLHGTVTGRLSSSNPNLQNIPKPDKDGGRIRNLFVATPGYTLVEGDFSQAEVRVLAYYCQDHNLLDALGSGQDIHVRTACLMFGKKPEEVAPDLRQKAKHLTFGVVYQMTPQGLADELGCSVAEAESLIRQWFGAYPRALEWVRAVQNQALTKGRVTTPFGRVRRFDFVTGETRSEIMRQAANAPIQSLASDITLRALIRLGWELGTSESTRLLLTVHDSILLETREDVRDVATWVRQHMLDSASVLGVPFAVDVKVGKQWGSLKEGG